MTGPWADVSTSPLLCTGVCHRVLEEKPYSTTTSQPTEQPDTIVFNYVYGRLILGDRTLPNLDFDSVSMTLMLGVCGKGQAFRVLETRVCYFSFPNILAWTGL